MSPQATVEAIRPEAPVAAPSKALSEMPTLRIRDLALGCVGATATVRDGAAESLETQFLHRHLDWINAAGADPKAVLLAAMRDPAPRDAWLCSLAVELELSLFELCAVALAADVEEDPMAGRALAWVQAPVGGSRPTLGLLATALAALLPSGQSAAAVLLNGPAVRTGLLVVLHENAPLPERAVAVPVPLCLALAGLDGQWPGTSAGLEDSAEVTLPPCLFEGAQNHAQGLLATASATLVARTGSPAEGRAVARAIARALRRRPLFVQTDMTAGLGPLLVLRQWLPVFCFELAPDERRMLPRLAGYRGPVLVVCGPDGSVDGATGPALTWTLPVPPRQERLLLWQAALNDDALSERLARDHRHGTGRIAHLSRLARHHAALDHRSRIERADIIAASWSGEGSGLESLAEPLRAEVPDEALVTTPELMAELRLLLLRCRSRDELAQGLGASARARYRPGVRALFAGASGTGKTLAVGWLATKLGLPLYRVDLAAVTSKYIGETEKNLAQLLARAEQAEVVLLFDEADSMFGKRTDIKDSNDRFANAQTNYLLQRIENFDGITILTSNSKARFDSAFARRLDFVVEFPLPGPEERRALWRSHLGLHHGLAPLELNQLAALVDVSGGHIRNAVFAAAVLAHEQSRAIAYADVLTGVAAELRKLGRQVPVDLQNHY